MSADVTAVIACPDHKPTDAIGYSIVIDQQGIIRCDKCERFATGVWFVMPTETVACEIHSSV